MKVPVYEPQAQVAIQPTGAREDVADSGAPGKALQRAGMVANDALGDFAKAQVHARQVADHTAAITGATKELQDLELQFDRDADWKTAPDRFQQGAAEIRDKWTAPIDDVAVKNLVARDFDRLAAVKGFNIKKDAFKKETDSAVAGVDDSIDTYAGLAASAKTPLERDLAIGRGRAAIAGAAAAKYLTQVDAGKRERGFLGKIDEVQARGIMTADPDAAVAVLTDPAQLPHIDEKRRAELYDTAVRRSVALEGKRQREADKAEKALGDAAAKEVYAADANGTLDRPFVEARRRWLTPSEYNGALKLLAPSAAQDDPQTLSRIMPRIDSEDLGNEITREFAGGNLSSPTYRALMEKNRSVLKDDQPASPYKSGRALVNETLDPGLLTGPAESALRGARAQALTEYDNWAAGNLKAPRADHLAQAQDVIRRYQVVAFDQMSLATGLPRAYAGTRQDLKPADLDAAEARTIADLDAARITRAQADQELRKIESWRGILQKKPAAPTSSGAKGK